MPDAPRTPSVRPPAAVAEDDVGAGPVLAQLLGNGWLAGHGTTQQLEAFVAAMRAVGTVASALPAGEPPAAAGGWATARPAPSHQRADSPDTTARGS